ncbi:hypothetical protein NY78_2671 [Desulfovibrio sp. TomC]|nr:hypothetical protein NY78_2671 [Desulfovibrio sp. TomC]
MGAVDIEPEDLPQRAPSAAVSAMLVSGRGRTAAHGGYAVLGNEEQTGLTKRF